MPRDINGNFTLLPGINPVVPGTDIEADWANPTLQDLANAVTDSLSRSGNGGMLAPFKFADGTLAAPSISWTNQPQSGWYRAGADDFRFSISGADILQLTAAAITAKKPLLDATGSAFVGAADATNIAITYAVALG